MTNPHSDLPFFQISTDSWLDSHFSLNSPQLIQRLSWLSELGITQLVLHPPLEPNKNFEQLVAFLQSHNFELFKEQGGPDFESGEDSLSGGQIRLMPYLAHPAEPVVAPFHFQLTQNLLSTALKSGKAAPLEKVFQAGLPTLHLASLMPASISPVDQKQNSLLQSLALSVPGYVLLNDQPEYALPLAPALEKAFHRLKTMIQIRAQLGCQARAACQWLNSGTPSVAVILKEGKQSKHLVLHNLSAEEVDLNLWRTGIAREMLSGKLVDLAGLDRLLGYQVMWLELE